MAVGSLTGKAVVYNIQTTVDGLNSITSRVGLVMQGLNSVAKEMKMRIVKKEDEYTKNPFYIATVEDNADPNNSYRVKVRIPEVHPESITTEELPWAGKVDMSFMGTGDTQDIHHSIPEVGTQVLVLAIKQNNINSLIYRLFV